MCAHNQHTMVDTDELGELMTLEMDSKKSYKWVIKKGLQFLSMFLIA